MTEAKAIAIMVEHMESQFPKTCPNCERRFNTLGEFFANAKPIGTPISYDLEEGDLNPEQPVGAVAVSNCPCGSSLAITSDGIALLRLWSLLHWARGESQRLKMQPREFLQYIRGKIRHQVLSDCGLAAVRGNEGGLMS